MQQAVEPISQKMKYYTQPMNEIRDPYAQISEDGFTVVGNIKPYAVANLYDRPEPTRLNDLPEVYVVPYKTSPFLGTNAPIRKDIDVDSNMLRSPVYLNRKSAVGTSQVTIYPEQDPFTPNPNYSVAMNNFFAQMKTIEGRPLGEDEMTEAPIESDKFMLNQINNGENTRRIVNRWDFVDPSVVQNVDNIIMNMKNQDGIDISLHACGISSRNELRTYVEVNKC